MEALTLLKVKAALLQQTMKKRRTEDGDQSMAEVKDSETGGVDSSIDVLKTKVQEQADLVRTLKRDHPKDSPEVGEAVKELLARKEALVAAGGTLSEDKPEAKKERKEGTPPNPSKLFNKRTIALLVVYNGKGYRGLQYQSDVETIEGDLEQALFKAGAISEQNYRDMHKTHWTRAARTDKGVHSIGQIIAFKALLVPDLLEKTNQFLPPQIRVLGYMRVQNKFNAHTKCTARTYEYTLPTYAFQPLAEYLNNLTQDSKDFPTDFLAARADEERKLSDEEIKTAYSYRISAERLQEVKNLLRVFVGTKNFWNYTRGERFEQERSKRQMKSVEAEEVFVHKGVEFVRIVIHGQSFMIYQIRKMIAFIVAVGRGVATLEDFHRTFLGEPIRIPIAPPLGLVMDRCFFQGYELRCNNASNTHGRLETFTEFFRRCEADRQAFKNEHVTKPLCDEECDTHSFLEFLRKHVDFYDFWGKVRPADEVWNYGKKGADAEDDEVGEEEPRVAVGVKQPRVPGQGGRQMGSGRQAKKRRQWEYHKKASDEAAAAPNGAEAKTDAKSPADGDSTGVKAAADANTNVDANAADRAGADTDAGASGDTTAIAMHDN